MNNSNDPKRLDRRVAIKWILFASASVPFLNSNSFGQSGPSIPTPRGYGSDPNLLIPEAAPWERILTPEQFKTTTTLADIILPANGESPSASGLNVPDFIDEWISAPYPAQEKDRKTILEGIDWINAESHYRFGKAFHDLDSSQQKTICDDICYQPKAKTEHLAGATFFATFRNLTMGGYYTTDHGTREVGYVGNVALASFDGPPPEVLKHLGVEKHPW